MSDELRKTPVRLAVVTGGHSYDVPNFHRLFRRLVECDVYIQHMDDFACSPPEVQQGYDVVLFYIMLRGEPKDEGMSWYCGKPRSAIEQLGGAGQGILVLHHAILAYEAWPVWNELVGIADRKFGYHVGQHVRVEVAATVHPITAGLEPWNVIDETYIMAEPGAGSEVLLTVEHTLSMRTIAWTRRFRGSRVFCLQSGHDNRTWENHNFREVLRRGILWAAGRI